MKRHHFLIIPVNFKMTDEEHFLKQVKIFKVNIET